MSATPAHAIDLRSDTLTRPSAGMRHAMANAEVGDDVFGEDPTVNSLQERAAALLGKEAALFVSSGTMANQLALLVHCRPGDEVIVGDGAHNANYESGAGGAFAGVQFAVAGHGGIFAVEDLVEAVRPASYNYPRTRLVCMENTHNRSGGKVWPKRQLDEVALEAHRRGLATHLDGARLLNAVAATGVGAADWAAHCDSATLCLSKGLGAPIGSLLAGTRDFIRDAHRFRKMLGGGMRQVGILAAAGHYALDHNVARLVEDHAAAQRFAAGVRAAPNVTVHEPESNIVMIDVTPGALFDAEAVVGRARAAGVLLVAMGARRVRAVTHLDVSAADCERAAALVAGVLADMAA